jgi:hypothetical protein
VDGTRNIDMGNKKDGRGEEKVGKIFSICSEFYMLMFQKYIICVSS